MTDTTTTTRADTLRALADRVEAGEIGREIDRAVLLATGQLHVQNNPMQTRWGALYRIAEDGSHVFGGAGDDILIRPVSSSLDAISALQEAVLPGWRVDKIMETTMEPSWRWMCILFTRSVDADISGHGPTEPAARLAACLRALLAMEAERS